MVNGAVYRGDEEEDEDDFKPHAWNAKTNNVKDDDYDDEEDDDEEDDEEEEGVNYNSTVGVPVEAVPTMPINYYSKVDSFLSIPPPVLLGTKPSKVEKLPNIGSKSKSTPKLSEMTNPNPNPNPNKSTSSKVSNKIRNKIESSISNSKKPLNTDLLQEAFQYTEALVKQNMADEADELMQNIGVTSNTIPGKKTKKISPEKQLKKQLQQIYGDSSPSAAAVAGDKYDEADYDDYSRNSVRANSNGNNAGIGLGGQSKLSSNDDMYVQLKNTSAKPSSHSSHKGPVVIKKSHPYLAHANNNNANGKKKKPPKKPSNNNSGNNGGTVNRLREDVSGQAQSSGRAQGAFENISTGFSQSNSNHSGTANDDMNSLIENFTKGTTLTRLKMELQQSKQSLDRSNQFMNQLASEMNVMK